MEHRISLVTLGVEDLGRAEAFYAAMGWEKHPASVDGNVTFYQALGQVLGLYPRASLSSDMHGRVLGEGSGGVTLAQNTREREEVDALFARALAAGGTEVAAPVDMPWGGYVAYVADPDGNVWEFAHVPGFPLAADGALVLPS